MISLYIHIPFCERKCLYCSFVIAIAKRHHIDSYLDCLRREIERYKGRKINTIHIGGGTPTFLRDDQLMNLSKMIRSAFSCSRKCEFTIEANPEGMNPEKAKLLFDLGINRVSLGVQSFNDRYLRFLGRCHGAQQAVAAFDSLRRAGFDNINLDMMYSFPGQTRQEIKDDLKRLVDLKSEHVSLYTLAVEPCSRFYSQRLKQPGDEDRAQHYEFVASFLRRYGFRQYEVSNFSRPGKESRHNLNTWQGGNYIGLGLGAHSHLNGRRCWNVSRLNEYISRIKENGDPVEGSEVLTSQTRLRESLLLGLRMNKGVDLKKLERRFACSLTQEKKDKMQEFVRGGLLKWEGDFLRTTSRGQLVLDELSVYLI